MTDRNSGLFCLGKYNIASLSVKQLSEIVDQLKLMSSPKDVIDNLRFLHAFSVSGKDTTEQILESGIIPVLSNFLVSGSEENVKVEVVSLISVLTLKSGKFNESLASETSLMMFSNLLETVSGKTSFQIVEAINQQIQIASNSSKTLVVSTNLILKLLETLKSKEVTDPMKMNIVTVVLNIVNVDGSENDVNDEDSSSSSSSSSSISSKQISFKMALARLGAVVASFRKSKNVGLAAMCRGCVQIFEEKYGTEFLVIADEGSDRKDLKVQFDPIAYGFTLSGKRINFNTQGGYATAFLSQSFTTKIYKIDIKMIYTDGNWDYYPGFCAETKKATFSDSEAEEGDYTLSSVGDSSCLHLASSAINIYYGRSTNRMNYYSSFPFQQKSEISFELNMMTHRLYFFINKKMLPVCIQNVPSKALAFGITGYYSSTWEVSSVCELAQASIKSSTSCSTLNWQ